MIETLRILAIVGFVLAGLFFTFVSATGVIRLPDVYSRAHTASQADTLGAGFALAGVALALGWGTTTFKTVLLLFFIFITNPTAAHAIARAADEQGIEPWTTDDGRTDRELYEAAQMKHDRHVADGGERIESVVAGGKSVEGAVESAKPAEDVGESAKPIEDVGESAKPTGSAPERTQDDRQKQGFEEPEHSSGGEGDL